MPLIVSPMEICKYVGEKENRFYVMVREEGLPAWQSAQRRTWKAKKTDLDVWIDMQREKCLKVNP